MVDVPVKSNAGSNIKPAAVEIAHGPSMIDVSAGRMAPSGLKSKIRFKPPFAEVVIRVSFQAPCFVILKIATQKSIPIVKTVEVEPDTNLPVILNEITNAWIKRQIIVFLKIFVLQVYVLKVADIEMSNDSAFFYL